MKSKLAAFFALAVGLVVAAAPIFAHHGAAVYDTKLTTLKGTVTSFQFMNPHVEIMFDVTDANGKVEKWMAEAASATSMARLGWTRNSFKPGDPVTAAGNVSKNGSHAMRLRKVVFPDGKETMMDRGEDYVDQ